MIHLANPPSLSLSTLCLLSIINNPSMSTTSRDSNCSPCFPSFLRQSATPAPGWRSASHRHPFLIMVSGLAAAHQVPRPAVRVRACREGWELLLLRCGNRCAFTAAHLSCTSLEWRTLWLLHKALTAGSHSANVPLDSLDLCLGFSFSGVFLWGRWRLQVTVVALH